MALGYWLLLLHAHLPYVRHPEYEDSLEERWLYETITETYLPLMDVLESLLRDGVDFRISFSLTPPLCNMLSDPLLQDRYLRYLERLIELSHKEMERTRHSPFEASARMYLEKFRRCRFQFVDQYKKNLLGGFRRFKESGKVEIVTCGATHGFFPLMNLHEKAVRAQIAIAKDSYRSFFGGDPSGIWNGECGYYSGLERHFKDFGIQYFFVESHGILYADHRPRYGVFAPIDCSNGVHAFGRDIDTGKAVWSSKTGYPGDFDYREFYRDIGFDLDFSYIKPYIHESGLRLMTGIKYHRITGETAQKEPYDPNRAMQKVQEHAENFLWNREQQIQFLSKIMDRPPLIVSPYDAELFGHWWYEGPAFIEAVLRKMDRFKSIQLVTALEYLEKHPKNQSTTPSFSSWGYKGYCEFWLNDKNQWLYRHLHHCSEIMIERASQNLHTQDANRVRILNQMARELLLVQSSDWAFIMTNQTTVHYAVQRTKKHIRQFLDLDQMLLENRFGLDYLKDLEERDAIFPEMNFRHYA